MSDNYITMDYSIYDTDKNTLHSYMDVYEKIFEKYRNDPVSMLEVGVASGGSLKLWKDFFKEGSCISGIDNWDFAKHDSSAIFTQDQANDLGVELFEGDAKTFQSNKKFDIIIDDGSHELEDIVLTLKNLWWNLKSGGLYVVEDVPSDNEPIAGPMWPNGEIITVAGLTESIEEIKTRTGLDCRVYDQTAVKNQFNDILLTFDKP